VGNGVEFFYMLAGFLFSCSISCLESVLKSSSIIVDLLTPFLFGLL
jgi:hypothetical protein